MSGAYIRRFTRGKPWFASHFVAVSAMVRGSDIAVVHKIGMLGSIRKGSL